MNDENDKQREGAPGPRANEERVAERIQESLLVRIAEGEAGAVAQLMERYSSLLWSLTRGMVATEAAEDLVQEIFVQLWRQAERYDPRIASEATFITMIARRRIIDHQRRVGRRPAPEEISVDVSIVDAELERPDIEDEARIALEALRELKPDQQLVLKLSIVDGLSHSQIADRTGMPLGTVKSHARRGLEKVRTLLGDRAHAFGSSSEQTP